MSTIVKIEQEYRSTDGEARIGRHHWRTEVTGPHALYYAQLEAERLKKECMFVRIITEGDKQVILHGYDSGD